MWKKQTTFAPEQPYRTPSFSSQTKEKIRFMCVRRECPWMHQPSSQSRVKQRRNQTGKSKNSCIMFSILWKTQDKNPPNDQYAKPILQISSNSKSEKLSSSSSKTFIHEPFLYIDSIERQRQPWKQRKLNPMQKIYGKKRRAEKSECQERNHSRKINNKICVI